MTDIQLRKNVNRLMTRYARHQHWRYHALSNPGRRLSLSEWEWVIDFWLPLCCYIHCFALNTFCLLTFKQQLDCDFQLFGAACVGLPITKLQLMLEKSLFNNTTKVIIMNIS